MVTDEGEEAQGEETIYNYLGAISCRPFNLRALIEDGEGQELCIGKVLRRGLPKNERPPP